MVIMPVHMFEGISQENEILREALAEIASGRIWNPQRYAEGLLERADSLLRAHTPVPDAPSNGDAEGVGP